MRDAKEITSISLRPPGIVGANCNKVWLSNIAERMKQNMPIKIYTPNFPTKNFVWVYDLANFIARLIDMKCWKYDVLNIACQESATVEEIIYEMKCRLHSASKIIIDDSVGNPFCLNPAKAIEMGYKSLNPLEIVREYCKVC